MGVVVLSGLLALSIAGPAQSGPGEPEQTPEEVVAEILELHRRIEALLDRLPADLRQEVERRLSEAPAEPDTQPASTPEADPSITSVAESAAGSEPEPEPDAPVPIAAGDPVAPDVPEPDPDPSSPPACNTLLAFDSNADGAITGADRYWRHLYLWIDRNNNGAIDDKEVEHLFQHDIADISLSLRRFGGKKGASGNIDRGEYVVFYLFSRRSKRSEDGVLVVDADDLRRSGGPSLETIDGDVLEGMQPFRRGLAMRSEDGVATGLNCP